MLAYEKRRLLTRSSHQLRSLTHKASDSEVDVDVHSHHDKNWQNNATQTSEVDDVLIAHHQRENAVFHGKGGILAPAKARQQGEKHTCKVVTREFAISPILYNYLNLTAITQLIEVYISIVKINLQIGKREADMIISS